MKATRLTRWVALAAGALTLTACGPRYEDAPDVLSIVRNGIVPLLSGGRGESGPTGPGISRALVEESGMDFLYASVPSRQSFALLQRAGENGRKITWLSEDGISVTYEQGLLVATRGLGPDLIAASVSGTVAAMRQGGGEARRVHEYLDGNDAIVRVDFDCRINRVGSDPITIYEYSYDTVKYEENCQSGGQRFTNTYWIDQAGVVWKSRQLISPPVGYLDTERL
ncbi:YjbF family lipoprotein [Roseisalinus antarcticus]|uniref:Lipoprotein GfcB n=1 Tax=Roseisalinus antarcticus TaxID=254357 RepID=A0A1Y5SK82_9RHOB|nr:YjbF family lipoprotein [Roseisalinus antarcticus]SLN42701.1 hypothetical protein ROA7023_01720 [Roseisalinus antarcticus]